MAKRKSKKVKMTHTRTKSARGPSWGESLNQDMLEKGKRAVGEVHGWAQRAGKFLPNAKDMHFPDQRALRSLVEERPLMLGAIGLGIGMVIGAVLPSYSLSMGQHASGNRRSQNVGTRQ